MNGRDDGSGRDRVSRRHALAAIGAGIAALSGCASGGSGGDGSDSTGGTDSSTDGGRGDTATPGTEGAGDGGGGDPAAWRTTTLTDVLTGEEFTVRELEGQPALLEFFAVWCPVCTSQQQSMRALLDRRPEVTAVSINTDPNEDAAKVRAHAEEYGFDWRYVVAPPALTRSFVDSFGSVITSPPSAPVVRVCPDGAAALLEGRRSKSVGDLAEALDRC